MTTGVQLFQVLKPRLGEKEAKALIGFVATFATKEDLKLLATKEELKLLATKEELTNVKVELAKVEGRLGTKIVEVKSDVMRWMFSLFVTMLLAILGLYFKK